MFLEIDNPHYYIYFIKSIISKLHIIEKVSDNIKDICAFWAIRKSKIKTKSGMCARWDLKVIRLCHIIVSWYTHNMARHGKMRINFAI